MSTNMQRRKLWMCALYLALAAGVLLLFSIDSQAASKKKSVSREEKYGTFIGNAPDTYASSGQTVYFYPKKVYYSGGKVVCYVYVVNKTGNQIVALSDVKLTLRNKKKQTVAEHTFAKKQKLKIENGKYKTVKYTFPKSHVKMKKFYFSKAKKMSIKASFTYYMP